MKASRYGRARVLTVCLLFAWPIGLLSFIDRVMASEGHEAHASPQLVTPATTLTYQPERVTITFGPVNVPSAHDGELAASLPKHVCELPDDFALLGFHACVYTKDGKELPRQYLHQILLITRDRHGTRM